MFAAKADILPQQYVEELSKLFDALHPAPYKEIKQVLEKEWGKDIYSVWYCTLVVTRSGIYLYAMI